MKKIILEQFTSEEFKEILSDVIKNELKSIKLDLPSPKEEEYLLTRKEVAKLLKITLPTLHEWTNKGLLKAYALGKNRVRYKRDEVMTLAIKK